MSNRELVQQLNGALMNSEGRDFGIRADFVREIIAALSAPSENRMNAPSVPHTFEPRQRPLVLVNAALHHSMQATHQLAALESENDKLREAVREQQAALQATQTEHPDKYRPMCREVLERWKIE